MRVLGEQHDAFGRQLLDQLAGEARDAFLERDDGVVRVALPAAVFFAEPRDWPAEERQAIELVLGRTLDVGCGAGRHALELAARGHEVVGIDVSPGAIEVCRRRGVTDARLLSLAQVSEELGRFDAILMMCGNFGLVGTPARARALLRRLHKLTSPAARILADTVDPTATTDPDNRAYHERNRARGRLPGQVRLRLRYRTYATPWFHLLNVSPGELVAILEATGWRVDEILRSGGSSYVGVLAKV